MKKIRSRLKLLVAEKEYKEGRRLSFSTISKETGISISAIAAYMQDSVTRFDADILLKLCDFIPCSLSELLVIEEMEP